jgi:Ran GTPase-activating protein (RanGAP) involved in mRNA processing and transport
MSDLEQHRLRLIEDHEQQLSEFQQLHLHLHEQHFLPLQERLIQEYEQEHERVRLRIAELHLQEQQQLSEFQQLRLQIAELHLQEQLHFLEYCARVRNNDQPFSICELNEREHLELADALLEHNSSVTTNLNLNSQTYTKRSAEAMAKYDVRTSKCLERIYWESEAYLREENLFLLLAFQESTSLKKLHINFPVIWSGVPSNLAFENMLTHTQGLESLILSCRGGYGKDIAEAAVSSGLKNNTTLQELTLVREHPSDATTLSPIWNSLCNHPLLQRLCLHGEGVDLTGLETLVLSDTSKITELEIVEIDNIHGGLTPVLHALARRPALTKLRLNHCALGCDEAKLLQLALRNLPFLQSLVLGGNNLGSTELAELAPALYRNKSIKVLDLSGNDLRDMKCAKLLRDIIRRNKTIVTLDLPGNKFGLTTDAVGCIADGLGNNSTLLEIDLSNCCLKNGAVSILAHALGSGRTKLQKLALGDNSIASTGLGVLLEMMQQSSNSITDLDLHHNSICNEGACLLAATLKKNALPNLTSLSLSNCFDVDEDGLIALVSALEQNTSLLHLDLRDAYNFSERAFSALAESLPDIKVLQGLDLRGCTGLMSAMPSLLAGLRKNKSLIRFCIDDNYSSSFAPTIEDTAPRYEGDWMQEIERLGYRNRFRSLIRAPKETRPPLGVWPRALARVAILPDVIFEVLRSKPSLVPSRDKQ